MFGLKYNLVSVVDIRFFGVTDLKLRANTVPKPLSLVVNEAALPCFSHNNIENVGKYCFMLLFLEKLLARSQNIFWQLVFLLYHLILQLFKANRNSVICFIKIPNCSKFLQFYKEHLVVSVFSYLVAIATLLAFVKECAFHSFSVANYIRYPV